MKDYMKSYQMVLRTIAPLFIGDGKNLNKKEYIYLRNEKKVLVPDQGRLYEGISRKRLAPQFTDYLLNQSNKDGLEQWLSRNGIRPMDYKAWIRYELDGGDHLGAGNRPIEINTFIKDGYGIPYVPGTSIKGMLRTILLSYELIRNPDVCKSVREGMTRSGFDGDSNRKRYLRYEAEDVENLILHTLHRKDKNGKEIDLKNAVNDVMSGLIVSDSGPIAWKHMILCQKMDRSVTGAFNNNLNVLRESVKSGVMIPFQLTIDTTICPYTIDDIMEAVKVFVEQYFKNHLQYYSGVGEPPKNMVWLGGGAGFLTKTVLYPLLGYENGLKAAVAVFDHTLPAKVKKEHGHDRDIKSGVSPHMLKCTQFNGRTSLMGMCQLSIQKTETI